MLKILPKSLNRRKLISIKGDESRQLAQGALVTTPERRQEEFKKGNTVIAVVGMTGKKISCMVTLDRNGDFALKQVS